MRHFNARRLPTRTRWKMQLFIVLTAFTVAYSAIVYLDVAKLVGVGHYDIHVELSDGGGLYPGSLVTLSGVEVGEVTSIEPSKSGVVAHLRLEDDAEIPGDVRVEVRSISAAGEQYLDIAQEPSSQNDDASEPATYGAGDTIAAADSTMPITTAELLRRVDGLVSDLPVKDLNTTVDELGVGLREGEGDLRKLLDAILPLQQEFTENLGPTTNLMKDAEPVLNTQRHSDTHLQTAAKRLAEFTKQLRASDKNLRGTIDDVPALSEQLTGVTRDLAPTFPVLLKSLTKVGEVTSTYDSAIRHILTVLPGVVNGFQTALNVSPVEGAVSLFARSVVNDPPACLNGFVQERRSPRELTPLAPPTKVYCRAGADSDQAVRGARNYPCPTGNGRGPSAIACGLGFQDPKKVGAVQQEALQQQLESARKHLVPGAKQGTEPYNPLDGGEEPSDGSSAPPNSQRDTDSNDWQSLLLAPLGLS